MTYPDTWCIAGRATPAALESARALLLRGERVILVTPDIASCAPLVGEFGDIILTVQVDPHDVDSSESAVDAIMLAMWDVTQLRVVPTGNGPMRTDITSLALRWPRASIGLLEHIVDDATAA